jgi:hypothetical protein
MILSPEHQKLYPLLTIGQKELPDPQESGHNKYWGYVTKTGITPEEITTELAPLTYQTKTRGERHIGAARPAGEGVYQILFHNNHTHLIYLLELPEKPGGVQNEFNIENQASYIITVKNPEAGSPPYAGLPENRNAQYPTYLQNKFGDRKYSDLDPTDFLNYEGSEFILVAASEKIRSNLDISLNTEKEDISSADIFNDLKIDRERPKKPLFEGEWE